MNSASSPAVEKIQRCHLPQWRICDINPRLGANTEVVVKKSIEAAITRQHLTGTVRLNADKRTQPDIYVDTSGRHFSVDCRHWTGTAARRGRVYPSREFYGSARRGADSLSAFLQDTKRFLYVGFELAVIDSTGRRERRLYCVPGMWLQYRFSTCVSIKIDELLNWPNFGKGSDLLYDIDIWKLIEIADETIYVLGDEGKAV